MASLWGRAPLPGAHRLDVCAAGSQTPFVDNPDAPPVGNIGGDVQLGCSFLASRPRGERAGAVSVTWEKEGLSGVVFRYQNRAAQLKDQNPLFRGRAQIFPGLLPSGNASLLLRRVEPEDAGVYRCSVSAPGGRGSVSVCLGVAGEDRAVRRSAISHQRREEQSFLTFSQPSLRNRVAERSREKTLQLITALTLLEGFFRFSRFHIRSKVLPIQLSK